MLTVPYVYVPAHDPYFLRFILDIPQGARKKAQKSPARAFITLNANQDSHRTPTIAATFLWIHGPVKLQLMIGHSILY